MIKKYLFTGAFILTTSFLLNAQTQDVSKSSQKFESALKVITGSYVDSTKADRLVEDAIVGMLKDLDPHSVYMSKEEIKKANEPLEGSFDGIGVQFNILRDTIMVVAAIPGGPSEKLGIKAGDKIIKVDGKEATGSKINNQWVTEKLRGVKGTKVIVTIQRNGVTEPLEFTIVRDKIPIYSLDAAYMVDDKTGMIKLNRFSATTMDEYSEAMTKLKAKGMENLILDLRGNGGGYLKTAIDLADEFLSDGKTIVYTEGTFSSKQTSDATGRGAFEKGKLIVLIDEGSASASEIVSGAIQDWDRGLVVGRRSFGKGLVQKPYYLSDGSVIRLTIARYHTPTGRCIQRPYEGGEEKYYKDLQNRMKHGELYYADSIKFPDSLKYFTPNKRIVYGGGGIMPDVFVPLDTASNSKYYTSVWSKGLIDQFIIDYIDKNRTKLLAQDTTLDAFVKNFAISNEVFDDFIKYAEAKGVKKDEEGLKISGPTIKVQLKARVARNLFGITGFYMVIRDIDETLNKAVELMNDNSFKKNKIAYK